MQSEEQFLLEQFESLPVEVRRQLIAVAKDYNENSDWMLAAKKAIESKNHGGYDKEKVINTASAALCVLVELDLKENKPQAEDKRHVSQHIDKLYNQIKTHR